MLLNAAVDVLKEKYKEDFQNLENIVVEYGGMQLMNNMQLVLPA